MRLRGLVREEIARLKLRRREELKLLSEELRADADLAGKLDLLSIPGLGERTAVAPVVRLPELGTLSREEVAALVGVAPFNHDSGRHAGERRIAGGRARPRKSLFAAAPNEPRSRRPLPTPQSQGQGTHRRDPRLHPKSSPSTPTLSSPGERCNGAWRYEFYETYDLPGSVEALNPILDSSSTSTTTEPLPE